MGTGKLHNSSEYLVVWLHCCSVKEEESIFLPAAVARQDKEASGQEFGNSCEHWQHQSDGCPVQSQENWTAAINIICF